jgi:ribonuclease III
LAPELSARAFTHSSWVQDRAESYERLEFLGDAVLGAVIAGELLRRFPDADEGQLAQLKAQIVSRRVCALVARQLDLGRALRERGQALGRDDADTLAETASVLAAVTESTVAAAFLSFGFETTRDGVIAAFSERIDEASETPADAKTTLQELTQRQGRTVQYVVVSDTGPPHQRRFESAVLVDGAESGRGTGSTKKESEQQAARAALVQLQTEER